MVKKVKLLKWGGVKKVLYLKNDIKIGGKA